MERANREHVRGRGWGSGGADSLDVLYMCGRYFTLSHGVNNMVRMELLVSNSSTERKMHAEGAQGNFIDGS